MWKQNGETSIDRACLAAIAYTVIQNTFHDVDIHCISNQS